MQNVLFWSGGKDSFLARHFIASEQQDLILLTTYDEDESVVPYQNIPISYIRKQAVALGHPLVLVPLPHPCLNEIYLERVIAAIGTIPFEIDSLVFGDWHLKDIRKWREDEFSTRGLRCKFPIWRKSVEELLKILENLDYKIVINSVGDSFKDDITPGMVYNREFIRNLPAAIDPMGENGEFHTRVVV